MRRIIFALSGLFMFSTVADAGPPVQAMTVECNWGKLTMEAVRGGFPQGPHSSDPSGDGHGPGTADEPRYGLANVVEPGNLQALCEFIADMLDD